MYSFQVQPDGSLANGAAFYRLEIADRSSLTGARGLAVDTTGCLYVATELGVQLCDLEGRTALIVANPPGHVVSSLTFGGPDFKTLYALAGSRLYRRPVTRQGGN
ncbi:MAG: SMP-30/gluconolactonase/LRE family protein [Armatimonadota bacterium]